MIILDISSGEEEMIQERKERELELEEEDYKEWYERNHSTQLQLEVVQ
jgi:hypothetical protein